MKTPGRWLPYSLIGAAATLLSGPASAHEVFGITGFPASILHPLIIIDQALALLAVALFAGQRSRPALLARLATLLLAMLIGFAALLYLPGYPGAPLLPLMAAALCGALVAWAPALPGWVSVLSIAFAGFVIGLNTIPEAGILMAFLYAIGGAMICAGVLFLAVVTVMRPLRRDWQRIGIRILGSWIAASAILVLALALVR